MQVGVNQQPKGNSHHFTTDLILGGFAGGISKTFVAPVERVKILLQTQDISPHITAEKRYKGLVDAFKRIPQEQGLLSFWRGNFANVLRYFPSQALNFAFKDKFKQMMPVYDSKTQTIKFLFANLLSGGLAGAASLVFVYPLDFARTRLATDVQKKHNREFQGIQDCIRKIYNKDGVTGLYRGFNISVWASILYRGIFFGLYDTLKQVLYQGQSSMMMNWVLAQSVTTLAGFACYPFDTVRRRLMMQSGEAQKHYKNSYDCFVKIVKFEGPKALYKGALSNVIRGSGGALVLVMYDELQKYMGIQTNVSIKQHA